MSCVRLADGRYLTDLHNGAFMLLHVGPLDDPQLQLALKNHQLTSLLIAPAEAAVLRQYDAQAGDAYLIRPDGHVAARFRRLTVPPLLAALSRALGKTANPTL